MVEVLDKIEVNIGDEQKARVLEQEILAAAEEFKESLQHSRQRFSRIGIKMLEVQQKKYWHVLGFPSFGSYVADKEEKLGLKRTSLYNTVSVARYLLPYVDKEKIEQMGVVKANLVAKSIRQNKTAPENETIDLAVSGTAEALKASLFKPEPESAEGKEKFYDFGNAYLTPEEINEVEQTLALAASVAGIENDVKEPLRTKILMLHIFADFRAGHEAAVQRGEF